MQLTDSNRCPWKNLKRVENKLVIVTQNVKYKIYDTKININGVKIFFHLGVRKGYNVQLVYFSLVDAINENASERMMRKKSYTILSLLLGEG